ncbi:MAG TPA: MFS transporter [Bacillota bacterium]|nr:MFS transporter [Bacillota bacterium]
MKLLVLILLGIGHMVVDMHGGSIPVLMLYLRDAFALSYTQVGLITLVSNLSSSVVQPLFGLSSDRVNLPWLLPLGLAVTTVGLALTGIVPHYYLALAAVFVSGLGIAAYHPEGSKIAHFAAGRKKSSAMSIYSFGGNLGHGLGPIVGNFFLGLWGLSGTLAFLAPGLITAAIFYFLQPKIMSSTSEARELWRRQKESTLENGAGKPAWSWGLFTLVVLVVFRSWIQYGIVTYLPFYYTDYMGGDTRVAAILIAVFLISGAAGTLLGGPFADRFGAKRHLCLSMILMLPLFYLLLQASGVEVIIIVALAGMVLISTFSPTVTMGQQYMPHHIGLASGLLIGFSIGLGGLGAPLLGLFADRYGVELVLKIVAVLPVAGLALALLLPRPPAEEAVPSATASPLTKQS